MSGNYPAGVTDSDPYFDLPSVGDDEDGDDPRMCPDCRGKGQYAGLDVTCRRCNGSGTWRPAPEPTTTPRQPTAADDPDWLNPAKGGNRAGDDYW